MTFLAIWAGALPALLAIALIAWCIATARHNAGLVDIFWPLFFLAAASIWAYGAQPLSLRAMVVLALVAAWSVRLAAHLLARNWNASEDRRYREIRARNEPGFAWKSIYLVFGLQAALAWLIAAPLAAAIGSAQAFASLDAAGAAIAAFGIAYEAIADAQLARFRTTTAHAASVMDRGLWRYSRHPNYFGEALTWWGLGLLAAGGGDWWALYSPLLLTWMLLRVTGVPLLEGDLAARRPGYREYVQRTSALVPWPARKAAAGSPSTPAPR